MKVQATPGSTIWNAMFLVRVYFIRKNDASSAKTATLLKYESVSAYTLNLFFFCKLKFHKLGDITK